MKSFPSCFVLAAVCTAIFSTSAYAQRDDQSRPQFGHERFGDGAGPRDLRGRPSLQAMDTDSDGRVSETEFVDARLARANDLFERLDRDDDGLLSDTDRKRVSRFDRRRGLDNTQLQACIAEREAPQGDRLVLQRADTDGDGSVGISEWSAALQAQATQAFALLDANGDGVVDQDEWQEQRNERRAERAEFRDCVRDKRRA